MRQRLWSSSLNRRGLGLLAAVSLLVFWNCTDNTSPPPPPNTTPSSVAPVAGSNNQTAEAGSAVTTPPSVTVTNSAGAGLSGVAVTFAVTGGGGSVAPASAMTNAQGVASATSWTLGTTAGSNTLTATVGTIVATFTATGTAGAAASVTVDAGDGQTAEVLTAVAIPPSVLVEDANNNPVAGETVTFTVTGGNGTVDGSASTTATTDAAGIAAVTDWTLGDVGANTLEATVTGVGTAAVFTATATGIPATVTISAGDGQTADAGTTLPVNASVEVRDASNLLLEGIPVTFTVTGGGGSVTGGMAVTDASGIATVGGWTLGTTPGANTLDASAGAATPATFNATGVVGAPSQIQITAGDAQSAVVATALTNPVQATLQDQFGNAVSGGDLNFAPSGDGSVDNPTVTTDGSGNASVTWTLATTSGAQTLDVTAAVGGVTAAAASATGFAGDATTLTITAGDNQSAVQGTAVAILPEVLAEDQYGNPAPSTSITFAPSGDGSVGASPVGTNAMGLATTSWTLTSTPGPNMLVATASAVAGTPSVTFNATATVQVGSIEINAGDGQSATVGTAVANPVTVLVRDVGNAPAPGIPVTFAVTLGGGSITGGTGITDAGGMLTLGSWTLGTTVGANEVQASVDSDPTNLFVLFNATATVDVATTMAVSAGDNQTAAVGTAVAVAPAVLITDQFGNPIQGTQVTFAPSGDGQVTMSPATTDASGVATVGSWTLATAPGANTLTASATGLTNVVFNATGTQMLVDIAIVQGNDQSGTLTGPLAVNPTVVVTDQGTSNPVQGVDVTFTPRTGEGTVNNMTVQTDVNGEASVQWTPGRSGSNFMDVTADGAATQFFAIASNSAYLIEVAFVTGGETTAQKQAFGDAAGRWMDIITGDLTSINFGGGLGPNQCGIGEPNITGIIDDVRIYAALVFIDGPGGILGSAGPCFIRNASAPPQPLTVIGVMRFDTADLANMEAAGTLTDVVLHEMGHVLGIGTLWNQPPLALLQNPSLVNGIGSDTYFSGANAIAAFNAFPGGPWVPPTSANSVVPVENTQGGAGTLDGHWRESTLGTELMTGFISGPGNPLSTLTIQSLLDMGYTVNIAQADPYNLATDGNPMGLRADVSTMFHLKDDIMRIPLRVVDANGRLLRIVDP